MNTDTIAIIVAVLGVGLALWRAVDSRYKDLRQDIKETNSRIDSMATGLHSRIDSMATGLHSRIDSMAAGLHSRIDALYQALFSRNDPAA